MTQSADPIDEVVYNRTIFRLIRQIGVAHVLALALQWSETSVASEIEGGNVPKVSKAKEASNEGASISSDSQNKELIFGTSENALAVDGKKQRQTQFNADGVNLTVSVVDFVPPIKLKLGVERLADNLAPWSTAYSVSLPHMARSYREWIDHVSQEFRQLIAADEATFLKKSAGGYPPRDVELLYTVEVDADGKRMLYLVERSVLIPGGKPSNGIKKFTFINGKWRVHAIDELKLVGRLPISDRVKLDEALVRGSF